MAEKVSRTAVKREPDWLYFIKDGAVWRKRKGASGAVPEKVADGGIAQEAGYIYSLDADGDIARNPIAVPVTYEAAFAAVAAHVGQPVSLHHTERGALEPGIHPITIFDWSKLDAKLRARVTKQHLKTLAADAGPSWTSTQVPFALVGGAGHPIPLDKLDAPCDGVLLVDLTRSTVMYCDDPSRSLALPIAPTTASLVIR